MQFLNNPFWNTKSFSTNICFMCFKFLLSFLIIILFLSFLKFNHFHIRFPESIYINFFSLMIFNSFYIYSVVEIDFAPF